MLNKSFMSTILSLVVVLVLSQALPAQAGSNQEVEMARFASFMSRFNKSYPTAAEKKYRFLVFSRNMADAQKMQLLNPLAQFGANEFSDMTPAEFKVMHNAEKWFKLRSTMPKDFLEVPPSKSSVARAVDWRAKGAVTYIRNQGSCGGCWAFSAAGNIEGQWFLANKTLVPLSEQQFISCDTLNSGCGGGLEYNAWKWIISSRKGQVVTEVSYPYNSSSGKAPTCSIAGKVVGANISAYKNLKATETTIADFMYTGGPVSIGVDATSWSSYMGGILTNCISKQMDHSVLAVGFDDIYPTPYWVIKNSWGTTWGEQGYIRIAKGTNQCLMANDPSTSIV